MPVDSDRKYTMFEMDNQTKHHDALQIKATCRKAYGGCGSTRHSGNCNRGHSQHIPKSLLAALREGQKEGNEKRSEEPGAGE